MATEVAPPTRWLAGEWENRCGYSSAVLSGIVPDARHKDDGGYHCSMLDLVAYGNAGDYSNRRALDKAPPVTAAGKKYGAAVDMSMSRADMKKLYGRALAVFSNRSDPRRKYLNAINVWDGIDGHSPRRLDFQANTNSAASRDHEWHSHEDQPRAYVDVNRNEQEAWTAARAFISMVKGETDAQWLASIGEDDMTKEEHEWLAGLFRAFCDPAKGFAVAPGTTRKPLAGLLGDVAYPLLNDPGADGSGAYVALWMRRQAAEAAGLRAAIEGMAEAIRAGGGSVDAAAIIAGVDRAVAAAVATLTAETRDAVADLGEGGAEQVRADE